MATLVLRNAHIRAAARRFSSSYALKKFASISEASSFSSSSPLDFVRGSSVARSTSGLGGQIRGGYGVWRNNVMRLRSQRMYLCSTSGAAIPGVANTAEVNDKDGRKSEETDNSGSQQSGQTGKDVRGGPVSWLSFVLLVITGAGIIWNYDNNKKEKIKEINAASTAVKEGPSVGKAAIGGPFSLINHDGKRVTDKDFQGKWTLIYFGFTHCPDICPAELEKLAAAIDKIKAKSGLEITPVFISVDPERDTPEQVGEYVKEFHPKIIGLTGSPSEIKDVARAYRVYFMKTNEEDDDYLVDHSIIMYLMAPDMGFVKFYGKNNDVDALTDGIIKEIKQYKTKH